MTCLQSWNFGFYLHCRYLLWAASTGNCCLCVTKELFVILLWPCGIANMNSPTHVKLRWKSKVKKISKFSHWRWHTSLTSESKLSSRTWQITRENDKSVFQLETLWSRSDYYVRKIKAIKCISNFIEHWIFQSIKSWVYSSQARITDPKQDFLSKGNISIQNFPSHLHVDDWREYY
jgi:hypothetical protein